VKPPAFEYCRPDTLDEALEVLHEFGPDASVLAGGLSLGAMLNMRLVRPAALVDIKRIPGLDEASVGSEIRTGATLTQARALEQETLMRAVPLLALALPCVGHFQTRNRGTLCGSVAHADPSAEMPLVLTTLDGEVELQSARSVRRMPAREFFVDIMTTAREQDELLTTLVWPPRRPGARYAFVEIAQRRGDFAIVACAVETVIDAQGRVVLLTMGLGGVEGRPIVTDTAKFIGESAGPELAQAIAASAAERVDPLTDVKASAAYRRALVHSLGAQAVAEAFAAKPADLTCGD
jgi:2-furoyl-CoA dehydrogenase FAD binding subunit